VQYRVLIAEDSNFFQMRLKEIIDEHPQLNVIGIAANGQEAIDMAAKLKPDIISMDYEMPFLDGVTAVRAIMAANPVPIVMFSSMTYEGAKITLDALEAGAVDFMNKNFAEVAGNARTFKEKLHEKLLLFAGNAKPRSARSFTDSTPAASSALSNNKLDSNSRNTTHRRVAHTNTPDSRERISGRYTPPSSSADAALRNNAARDRQAETPPARAMPTRRLKGKVKLLVIGASTGGPVAVAEVICRLPANFPVPILIAQHMPENFTQAFAERMNRQSALTVAQAESGSRVEQGFVWVAPGGKQMMLERGGRSVKVIDGDDRVNYKPSVDITFASAASIYGDGVLGIMLTGMGSDGCDGARLIKEKGGTIWSQDRATSVVYGMPASVEKHNITSCILPIKDIARKLMSEL